MIEQVTSARRWWLTIGVLLVFTAVSRVPFRSHVASNWDAVQYILALRHFDIAAHQPHPPGNPLYVLLGRGVHVLTGDPNLALVVISILASVVAVWGTALLGAWVAGRAVGFWAALLLAVNPLFWYYGETALSYTPEAAAGVLVALAVWRCLKVGGWRPAVLAGLALAAAGGLRPTVLPLLGPLWLLGLLRLSWRERAVASGTAAAGSLAWLVPLLVLSGGPAAYWTQLRRLTAIAVEPTSLLVHGPSRHWLHNLGEVAVATVVALNVVGVLAALALRRQRPRVWPLSERSLFLWLWILPPLGMFSLVHFGQWGYLLLILPPALLLGLVEIGRLWPLVSRPGLARLSGAVAVSALIFLGTPLLPLAPGAFQPTAAALRGHDDAWRRARQIISILPPSQTLVLTSADGRQSFRLAGYLLPSYEVVGVGRDWDGTWGSLYYAEGGHSSYHLDPRLRASDSVWSSSLDFIVVMDESLVSKVPDASSWARMRLADGSPLLIRAVGPGSAYVSFSDHEIRVFSSLAVRPPQRDWLGRGS